MSYNNNFGGYPTDWLNAPHGHPLGPDDGTRNGAAAARSASGLVDWSQEQYLPEVWGQATPQPPGSSSRSIPSDHRPPRPLRYEPYQIPHHAPPVAHLNPSSSAIGPSQFQHFDLSSSAFLHHPSTLADWQGSLEQSRRDSDSTRSPTSRENSDPKAATPAVFGHQHQQPASPPDFDAEDSQADNAEPATRGTGDKKLVKKADKSCRKCRDRRVRCDRVYPVCDRCRKRRENCSWADTVTWNEYEEGGDAQKVIELQSKVAALERQLKASGSNALPPFPASQQNALPAPEKRPNQGQGSPSSGRSGSNTSATGSNPSRVPPTPPDTSSYSIVSSIGEIYSGQLRFKQDETTHLISYLMGMGVSFADLGHSNPNWRLGEPEIMRQLTIHLMEAATRACCANIPGIKPLADRVEFYKRNLEKLDAAGQCAVAVLCALGARASPHSALLGVATTSLADGTPSPPLFLYAGERREMACRALERRAREVCWVNGMLESSNLSDLDSIIGLTQVLIYEEILPQRSRLFTRVACGMYHDLRFKAIERNERTSRDPRIGPGTALFLADAVIAASSSRPSFISTSELELYYLTDGVPIPDFPGSNLLDELDRILTKPLTKEKLIDAITQGTIWVSGCARLHAQLTMSRRPNSPSPLPLLKNLWSLVDNVHNSLQHLQSIFVHLEQSQVADLDDSPYALDHFVLLGVRADSVLVDLINLMHLWLKKDRNGEGLWMEKESDPFLLEMRQESELRVRKCLKLSAFYAQLFLSSQDKHLVHHMMMQLEILSDWTEWAVQRVGSPGGPPSAEYEITEAELDWFQRALELACYYTPKAANRLQRLAALRRAESERPFARLHARPLVPPASLDTVVPPQAIYDGSHAQSSSAEGDLFSLGGGFVGSPSQLWIFDDYGIAAQQEYAPGTQDPLTHDDTFRRGFTGQSWIFVDKTNESGDGGLLGSVLPDFVQ
ncbi:hypothetical protein JCM11491_006842 [Sporobolomyces phaffii]